MPEAAEENPGLDAYLGDGKGTAADEGKANEGGEPGPQGAPEEDVLIGIFASEEVEEMDLTALMADLEDLDGSALLEQALETARRLRDALGVTERPET